MKLNKSNLASQVADMIYNNYIKPHSKGYKLPTEVELMKQYKVSRNTIREGIKLLVAKDMLKVIQGSGTYIKSKVDPMDYKKAFKALNDNFMITFAGSRISIAPKKIEKYSSYNVPMSVKECELIKKCLED